MSVEQQRIQNSYEQVMQKTKDTSTAINKPTAPVIAGWSDQTLSDLRDQISFPESAYHRSNLKKILSRFFEFYFNGTIRANDHLSSVVFDVVAIAETESGPIWTIENARATGFYPTNLSDGEEVQDAGTGVLPQVALLVTGVSRAEEEEYHKLLATYSAKNVMDFKATVSQAIRGINIHRGATAEESALVRLASFLALTLCRFATKNKAQMGNAFLKTQYIINITSVALWPAGKPFSPPCTECLAKCEQGLVKGLSATSNMFIILANEFVRCSKGENTNMQASGFLSASVLTHTARNGLGLIQMVELACTITSLTFRTLCGKSFYTVTEGAWITITDFYFTQLTPPHIQYGYHWARIINDGYLRGLSPKEAPFLATILAAIIEKVQGEGVWTAEWAKTGAIDMDDARYLGLAIYNASRPKLDQLIGPESAMTTARDAERLKKTGADMNGLANRAMEAEW